MYNDIKAITNYNFEIKNNEVFFDEELTNDMLIDLNYLFKFDLVNRNKIIILEDKFESFKNQINYESNCLSLYPFIWKN